MTSVRATTRLISGSHGIPLAVVGAALSGLLLAGCGAPPGSAADDITGVETQATTTTTQTIHSRAIRKWSNAVKFHGSAADYLACGGDKLKLTFTFENLGSAEWFDVNGRGTKPGSDVFLVTASGKKDPITHKVYYSLRKNRNHRVRGDRLARNCSMVNGCRKTTFIRGGMAGVAPSEPGIYNSRWRLRDFSKAWGSQSKAFSMKVDTRIKVVDCSDCGCTVACSQGGDGKSHVIPDIQNLADCTSAAAAFCAQETGAVYVRHFKLCPPHTTENSDGFAGTVPSGGSGGSVGSGGTGSGGGGSGGGGGGYGIGGGTGSGGGAAAGAGGVGPGYSPGSAQDPNGYNVVDDGTGSQQPDDPGYSDGNFHGDADLSRGSTVAATGCSVGVRRPRGLPPATGPLFLLLAVVGVRRRAHRRAERG